MQQPDLGRALEYLGIDPDLATVGEWQPPRRATLRRDRVMWDYVMLNGPYGAKKPEASFTHFEQWARHLPSAPDSQVGRVALAEFLALASAEPPEFAAFVKKWGPLHLCHQHRMPMTHPPFDSRTTRRRGLFCAGVRGDGTWGVERVIDMRYWARLAMAIVSVHAALSAGNLPVEDTESCRLLGLPGTHTPNEAWSALNRHLNFLLMLGLVGPAVQLEAKPRYAQRAFGIFGIMVRELVQGLLGERLALCASCGGLYAPRRLPRAGEDTWCYEPQCREQMRLRAFRDRSRGHRARS